MKLFLTLTCLGCLLVQIHAAEPNSPRALEQPPDLHLTRLSWSTGLVLATECR